MNFYETILAKVTHKVFLERSNKAHNYKYQYPEEIIHTMTDIKVICPVHGIFTCKPKYHMAGGKGCLLCYKDIRAKSQDTWIKEATSLWGTNYLYTGLYVSAHKPIEIVCRVHRTI
jgi:hypothetical protein